MKLTFVKSQDEIKGILLAVEDLGESKLVNSISQDKYTEAKINVQANNRKKGIMKLMLTFKK